MGIENIKIDDDRFMQMRKAVLGSYKTGAEVDIEDGIAYQKALPTHKVLAHELKNAREGNYTLGHNLTGQSTAQSQFEFLECLQNDGGAGLLQCLYDSYTRTGRFEHLENVIAQCEREGWSEKMKEQANEGCNLKGFLTEPAAWLIISSRLTEV